MTHCHICRAKYTGKNPTVQCGEGYPWPHHCTICQRACGGCNRRTPSWQRVVSRRWNELGVEEEWYGWVMAA